MSSANSLSASWRCSSSSLALRRRFQRKNAPDYSRQRGEHAARRQQLGHHAEAVFVLRGPRYESPGEVAILKVGDHSVVDFLIRAPGHVDQTPAVLRVHHHHARVRWSTSFARLLRQKLRSVGDIGVRVRDQEGVERISRLGGRLIKGRLYVPFLGGAEHVRFVEDRVRALRRRERCEKHCRYHEHQRRETKPR
jgi:hypothetical protein